MDLIASLRGLYARSGLSSVLRGQAGQPDLPDLRAELLRHFDAHTPAVLLANAVNGALVVLVFWGALGRTLLLGWYALIVATVATRLLLWRRHRRAPATPDRVRRWGLLAIFGSATSGLLWGLAGGLFFVPYSPVHDTLLAFVLAGMGAGAVATLTAHLPAFLAYFVPSIVPFGVRLAIVADAEHLVMAALTFFYLVALLLVAWRAHLALAQTLALRLTGADLLRTAALVDASFDAILGTTPDGRITEWNAAAASMFGRSAHEVLDRSIAMIVPAARRAELRQVYERLRQGEPVEPFETECPMPDGRRRKAVLFLAAVEDDTGTVIRISGVGRDATEDTRARWTTPARAGEIGPILDPAVGGIISTTRRLAFHDPLTSLPNRALFHDRLQHALAGAGRHDGLVALLLLDLDHLKATNDGHGHVVGDRLLVEVARRLDASVRASDTVARLGGDEFAVILPELPRSADAAVVARKMLDALAAPVRVEGRDVHTGASIGIVVHPADGHHPEELLRHADLALYRAKAEGRGTYRFYASAMEAQVEAQKALERDLRRALERDELELDFQPQQDLTTGRIIGVEALVRWRHARRGRLAPAEFIPLAESSGLIAPLGAWVLRSACRQARAWRTAGLPPIAIAVNLSPAQCRDGELRDVAIEALRATGLDPHWLALEVTESVFLAPPNGPLDELRQLRARGVRCAIDDFGTGCCNLGGLRQLPVDQIKIDRSLVAELGHGADADATVRAMIGLGRALGLGVIAEGVETAAQYAFLRAEGCQAAQGFHVGRPLPPGELAGRLAANETAVR